MPYVPQTQHIERVRAAIEGRMPLPAESTRLVSSWQRSYETWQLDPSSVVGPRVLTSSELREVQNKEASFLRASGQCLTRLHDMIRVADYCVMLTDAHGVTIDYRIDRDRRQDFKHAGLHIGSCWSEREEGTCGIASVLTDLAPITVHKTDHFRAAFTTLTCSAAPIFAPSGTLIGVLDASAIHSPDQRDSQRLVYQLVRQSASVIEDGFFLNQTSQHWMLFAHPGRDYVEAQPELLIAFDECGNIVSANRKAHESIPALSENPRHLDEIFDTLGLHLQDFARTDTIVPLRLHQNGTMLYARIRAPMRRPTRAPSNLGTVEPVPRRDTGTMTAFARSIDRHIAQNARTAILIAGKRLPVLLLGETGVGKEVFARAMHDADPRRGRPFVAVNCGAIPESLIESELFGYTAGAFTGAKSRGARGKMVQAHGGTLFLDEIGDMPLSLQTRLLRVLSEGEVVPLGGDTPVRVDIDVICATHRDLAQMVEEGAFREDLYYRLSGATLRMPPLRERADIRDIVEAVFDEEARIAQRVLTLDPEAEACLSAFSWPGNIRQLRNALRFACAVCDGNRIGIRHLPPDLADQIVQASSEDNAAHTTTPFLPDDERTRIVDALTRHQWHPNAAALALNISRATLYRRIAKLGIVGPHRMT